MEKVQSNSIDKKNGLEQSKNDNSSSLPRLVGTRAAYIQYGNHFSVLMVGCKAQIFNMVIISLC